MASRRPGTTPDGHALRRPWPNRAQSGRRVHRRDQVRRDPQPQGKLYKPSAIRGYERDLQTRVVPNFGAARLREVTLPEVQRFADSLSAEGLAPSTCRNVVKPLQALYGWALPRGMAQTNPCRGLRLPTGGASRSRIVTPAEASKLIAALLPRDQAALGLAVYAGLRLGELLALDWSTVDIDARALRVERAWDPNARKFIEPKSKAGARTVPITDRLSLLLADHRVLMNQATDGLLFPGADAARPVHPTSLYERVANAWKAAKLRPLGFHDARHTAASLFIAAGMNAKTVTTLLGHSSITITFDRYGHLFPGAEDQARGLLDVYLEHQED